MLTSVFPRWPGDATPPFVQNLCELLARDGVEVMVLAPHSRGSAFSELWNAVLVKRHVYFWPLALQKLCYEGGMLVNFKERPWSKLLLPFFFLSQLVAAFYFCFRFKPDLIHSHSLLPQGFTGVIVSRLLGLPHVTTSHGNDVFGLKANGFMGMLKRYSLKHAGATTVNSSATREAVLALGATADRVHLVPAVANLGRVDPNVVNSIEKKYGQVPKVLFVGRFIEEKGVLDLLRAFASIHSQIAGAECFFVGDGPLRYEMEALAADLGIVKSVDLVGWQSGDTVASWMAAADVLVVPSKPVGTWQEAQGLVVIEAMSVGTPVIASRIGGIPDMVEDGVTGRLFPAGDTERLGALIVEIFTNNKQRARMTAAALTKVSERYSPDAVARLTEQIYRDYIIYRTR
ncbi:MAG: glycosyltransferase [Verrucomicrobia bacterium]|nr:glycosyltransferase [Verrucomicrobiota bacterium]